METTMNRLSVGGRGLITGVVCFGLLSAVSSFGAESGGHSGHPHLGVFVGAGEEKFGDFTLNAKAIGLVYEYKFGNGWDIGGVLERLEVFNQTSTVAVVVAGHSFSTGIRLFGGPGYDFRSSPAEDVWLFRTGISYEFHLNKRWTLAPEAYVDFIENGAEVRMLGVVLGYAF